MTSTVPGWLAGPLLGFMASVTLLRYLYFHHNQWERYLNHTLAFMFVSNLIRERVVQDQLSAVGIMTVTEAQQLSLALMMFAAVEFMGFVTLYMRSDDDRVRLRQRYYRLATILGAAMFFIAAAPARAAGQTLEEHGGWSSVVAWSIYVLPLIAVALQLGHMCIQEIRRHDVKRRERMVAAGGLGLGISIGVTSIEAPLLAAFEELGWLYSRDYRSALHGFIFFTESVGANILAFIPFVVAAGVRAGLDATSRHWRQLQPLREQMIAAVPAAAFDLKSPPTGRRKSAIELHQTTVQIRDAILQLRAYFRDVGTLRAIRYLREHGVPSRFHEDALTALQLADAVQAKASGISPKPLDDYGGAIVSRATTLEDETADLMRLARWWPQAQRTAARNPNPQSVRKRANLATDELSEK